MGEVYDTDQNIRLHEPMTRQKLQSMLREAIDADSTLRHTLGSSTVYGNAILTHCLKPLDISLNSKVVLLTMHCVRTDKYTGAVEGISTAHGRRRRRVEPNASPLLRGCGQPCQGDSRCGLQGMKDGDSDSADGLAAQGYITLKPNKHAGKEGAADTVYDEFLPYLYNQYEGMEYKQFGSFGAAVDEFFATIESQKIEAQKFAQEVSGFAYFLHSPVNELWCQGGSV